MPDIYLVAVYLTDVRGLQFPQPFPCRWIPGHVQPLAMIK